MPDRVTAVADTENLRVRLRDDLKAKFDAMIKARGVTQQRALETLVEWITGEDAITQLMVFQQTEVEDRAELSRLVLRRLGGQSKKKTARRG